MNVRIDVNRISPLRSSIKASLRLALFYYVKMVGLLLIGGCRNKKIFIFKGISATADAVRIQSSRQNEAGSRTSWFCCFFCCYGGTCKPAAKQQKKLTHCVCHLLDMWAGWYSLIDGCGAENIYFPMVPRFGFAVQIQSSRQNRIGRREILRLFY